MIAFLISLLVLLFYAGVVLLIVFLLFYFFAKIFGEPVHPRVQQIVYALIGLLFLIWLLQSLATHTPVPTPWQWNLTR